MDLVTLSLAKKFTTDSLVGVGALKGANCEVASITDVTEGTAVIGQKVTFSWEDTQGETQTDDMEIDYSDIAAMVLASLTVAESQEV